MNEDSATITIREAEPADIDGMVSLLEFLFSIEKDFSSDPERQRRGLALLLDSPAAVAFVAETNQGVIGMVSGQLLVSTAEGGLALVVEDLVVDRDRQGRGVGSGLLDAVIGWAVARGAARFQLLADSDNRHGLDFYRNLGWKRTSLICLRSRSPGRSSPCRRPLG